jgi:membrane protease YdiL (CAAX protease family)
MTDKAPPRETDADETDADETDALVEARTGKNERANDEPSEASRPPWAVLVVIAIIALAMTVALQPSWLGSRVPWFVMLGTYLGLAVWSLLDTYRNGLFWERFRVRAGDVSIGILLGLGLAAAGVVGQRFLAAPGSAGAKWLLEVFLAAGDFQKDPLSIVVLCVVAVCEEAVWRGMVQDQLTRWNERSAPGLTALGYGAATLPSVVLLSANGSGNPLLLLAALGAGLVLSYARRVVPRLLPLMIAHVVFTYFMAAPLPNWL